MKQIKIYAMLFIVLVAMSSCAKQDTPSSASNILMKKLVGEWIVEMPVSGLEANLSSDIVIPDDGDMLTMIFHFNDDGTGWKELNVMREGEMIYSVINRYEMEFMYSIDDQGKIEVNYETEDINDELYFNGIMLTTAFGGVDFYLVRATDEQIKSYKDASDAWHGGSDEGGSIETGIDDSDASEPSRVSRLDVGIR